MTGEPAFGHIRGAGRSSLKARDASRSGGRGRTGAGSSRGRGLSNGNYIARRRNTTVSATYTKPKEDDHEAEAALGFPLFTDGPDRLGWLFNMNSVRYLKYFPFNSKIFEFLFTYNTPLIDHLYPT